MLHILSIVHEFNRSVLLNVFYVSLLVISVKHGCSENGYNELMLIAK